MVPAERFEEVKAGFKLRWVDLGGKTRNFSLWSSDLKEDQIKERFDMLVKERFSVYFVNSKEVEKGAFGTWKPVYKMAENWEEWHSRYPYPIAFHYSLASPTYNANIVLVGEHRFLAMEAPCDKNLTDFFDLLDLYAVTDLVRLAPTVYKGREESFPYWEGRISIHPESRDLVLKIKEKEIAYFPIDTWEDHEGFDSKRLIALVKAVRASADPGTTIGVHCRAGVGRTATFIAAYVLANDIDQQISAGVSPDQIKVSIDEVVWKMCLQRPFMVTHFPQYLTLYQFVESYIATLQV